MDAVKKALYARHQGGVSERACNKKKQVQKDFERMSLTRPKKIFPPLTSRFRDCSMRVGGLGTNNAATPVSALLPTHVVDEETGYLLSALALKGKELFISKRLGRGVMNVLQSTTLQLGGCSCVSVCIVYFYNIF